MTDIRVYQAADDRWLVSNNGIKSDYFTLQEDAQKMADKIKFTSQAQAWCTQLAALFKDAPDLVGVYFDEGFNSGSNVIEDEDIESLPGPPTAASVSAFVTAAQQLQKFDIGDPGDPVVNANYGSSVNAMRTDV